MIASFIAWLGACVLAILDVLICILYIMLFGIDAAIVYLKASNLFILYHIYIVPAFVLSRITQLAIPYMVILTTMERFVWISGQNTTKFLKRMFSDRGHQITIFLLLLCCTISRLPTAFAIVVHHFPNCNDFLRTQSTGPADWVHESKVYYFFDFHLLSIAQTFVPFIVLVVFNCVSFSNMSFFIIIRKLLRGNLDQQRYSIKEINQRNGHYLSDQNSTFNYHLKQYENRLSVPNSPRVFDKSNQSSSIREYKRHLSTIVWNPKFKDHDGLLCETKSELSTGSTKPLRKMRTPVRDAIYTMFAIVTSYLISNSLHLILTILERWQISILRDPDDPMMASTFHTVFSDTVSFVYMFTSAIRIIIYTCNPAIRMHLKEFLSCNNHRCGRKRSSSAASIAASV
uniref:G_PROTEIN_RECEP_F1_2 domain-containing protein n=1 Tax=Elaeophora elaphi TaxID=1147741 RepID=A0A0R3RYB5_9BILA